MRSEESDDYLKFELNFLFMPVNVGYITGVVTDLLGQFEVQPSLVQGVEIVILELVDNAAKFRKSFVGLQLRQSRHNFTITVRNDFVSLSDPGHLVDLINTVTAADAPEKYYERRIRELFTDRHGPSPGLGIYRILCEAQFKLKCDIEKNIVTVTAVRNN